MSCCEPSGEMVGTLRDALRLGGVEVGAALARVALTAALMAEHERCDQKVASRDGSDPRSPSRGRSEAS